MTSNLGISPSGLGEYVALFNGEAMEATWEGKQGWLPN